jgi:hypothetical protein
MTATRPRRVASKLKAAVLLTLDSSASALAVGWPRRVRVRANRRRRKRIAGLIHPRHSAATTSKACGLADQQCSRFAAQRANAGRVKRIYSGEG